MFEKEKLIALIRSFGIDFDYEKINYALMFFRKSYTERPYKYPSDAELYRTIQRCLLQGHDFKKSIDLTLEIIKREILIKDYYYLIGIVYYENFYPESIELNTSNSVQRKYPLN